MLACQSGEYEAKVKVKVRVSSERASVNDGFVYLYHYLLLCCWLNGLLMYDRAR